MAFTGDSSTPIETGVRASTAEAPSASPAPTTRPTSATQPRSVARGAFLILVVSALGFLLAAFPARNSDAWLHLATGKLLATGDAGFEADRFLHTTAGANWVNHAWLSDRIGYAVYSVGGGFALVLVKALLIAGVGLLLLLLGWTRDNPGVPAACALLALLALGQSIPLHPICISCLFLALTLWLLERARRLPTAPGQNAFLRYLPVLVLCALWVNLDAWFVLGPLTIALYLLGAALQGRKAPRKSEDPEQPTPADTPLGVLAIVFAASLLCCLINPQLHQAFELPPPLSFLLFPAEVQQDPWIGQFLLQSPFRAGYAMSTFGGNVPGAAYYLLALFSLLSFLLNRKRFSATWAFLWTGFFCLSAFHTRLIPFFAIVAGPCLARNLQDWLAERAEHKQSKTAGSRAGVRRWESLAALVGIVLVVLAWPGWLQPSPHERRSLALVSDPALEKTARQLLAWKEHHLLPTSQFLFNNTNETADYLAWASANSENIREPCYLDSRFGMIPADALLDFVRIRQALEGKTDISDLQTLLRTKKIDRLVLSDGNMEHLAKLLRPMRNKPSEWVMVAHNGRTVVLCWRDPKAPKGSETFASLAGWFKLTDKSLKALEAEAALDVVRPLRALEDQEFEWAAFVDEVTRLLPPPKSKDEEEEESLTNNVAASATILLQSQPFAAALCSSYYLRNSQDKEEQVNYLELVLTHAAIPAGEEQRGFHPATDKQAPASLDRLPRQASWSAPFFAERPVRNPDRDEADLHLAHFRAIQGSHEGQKQMLTAALVGLAMPTETALGPTLRTALAVSALHDDNPGTGNETNSPQTNLAPAAWVRRGLAFQMNEGPPSSLFQAIRAARRAVKTNPDDGRSWLLLGEAYSRLLNQTSERYLSMRLPDRVRLRRVQAATALRQGLLLHPDAADAHYNLGLLYRDLRCEDLYLKHIKEWLRLTRGIRQANESDKDFKAREAAQREQLVLEEEQLKKKDEDLEKAFLGRKVLDRVRLAQQNGMAGKALDLLLASDVAGHGGLERAIELDLRLNTGQANMMQDGSDPQDIPPQGRERYFMSRAILHAALGNYDQSDKDLVKRLSPVQTLPGKQETTTRGLIAILIADAFLSKTPSPRLPIAHVLPEEYAFLLLNLYGELMREAEVDVYRGLLALEAGRTNEVETMLRRTLDRWERAASGAQGRLDIPIRPLAQYYLQRLEASKPASP
jgi:hypothetical protein